MDAMGAATAMEASEATATADAGVERRGGEALVSAAPTSVSDLMDEQHDRSQCDMVFEKMSRGRGLIDLEGYLAYFGAHLLDRGRQRKLD